MELAVSAATSYSPMQESLLQRPVAAVQRQAVKPRDEAASVRQDGANQREQLDPRRESAREARKSVASEPVSQAGFKFEYQEAARVMKVQDSKGILIYQVPSKGQLALLEAAETSATKVETTA